MIKDKKPWITKHTLLLMNEDRKYKNMKDGNCKRYKKFLQVIKVDHQLSQLNLKKLNYIFLIKKNLLY